MLEEKISTPKSPWNTISTEIVLYGMVTCRAEQNYAFIVSVNSNFLANVISLTLSEPI